MRNPLLTQRPIHLGLQASTVVQPEFTGLPEWYAAYGARHDGDGVEGRLVAMHTFTSAWTSWEMHPSGSEVVLCTDGQITLLQEQADGAVTRVALVAGEYAINPPGVWHTADVEDSATCVFITAGLGTTHKARD